MQFIIITKGFIEKQQSWQSLLLSFLCLILVHVTILAVYCWERGCYQNAGCCSSSKVTFFLLIKTSVSSLTIFGCLSAITCLHENCVNANGCSETLMNKNYLRLLRLPHRQQRLLIQMLQTRPPQSITRGLWLQAKQNIELQKTECLGVTGWGSIHDLRSLVNLQLELFSHNYATHRDKPRKEFVIAVLMEYFMYCTTDRSSEDLRHAE